MIIDLSKLFEGHVFPLPLFNRMGESLTFAILLSIHFTMMFVYSKERKSSSLRGGSDFVSQK